MDVVVLVKQVPDTGSNLEIAEDKKNIQLDNIKWVMNPYDEIAVEAALTFAKEKQGRVTVVSFGPLRSQDSVRTALAMGADKGILIIDPENCRYDPFTTAAVLSTALQQIPCDIIFAGARSVDFDNFQTGSAIAQNLGIPQITQVTRLDIIENAIVCHQITEGGELVKQCPLPALVTCQRGLNEPRYPSLPGIMKAKKKPLEKKELSEIGLDAELGQKSKIISLAFPEERRAARMIEGETPQACASKLVDILHNEVKAI